MSVSLRSPRRLARRALARLRAVSIHDAAVADRRLRLRLGARGVRLGAGTTVTLVGPRQQVDGVWRDATTVEFDLQQVPPFGTTTTVLRPGAYTVQVRTGRGALAVRTELTQPYAYADAELAVSVRRSRADGRAVVEVAPARRPEERGEDGRRRLRTGYRRALTDPLHDVVHLTCFDGRGTGDNVGPVAAELARRRPGLEQRWTVADPGVELPAGTSGVLVRTTEWWASQATARVLVVNCWLPVGFQRRPGQVILQTWHGTPYKTLGLDRLGEPAADAAKAAGLRRHAGLWDLLLAQNAYSAGIFARAYGFDRDPLLVGYPRNDRLVPGYPDAELARVRRRLGVGDGTRLVLYAPTFRDDDPGLFRGLDLTALGRGLGPGHVTMVRGHGNTVRHDRAVELPGVVDVTLYPDLAELFAVADVLVTDYSSAMFDFAITGKPLVFFVPDLARYTGSIRGSYFDLAAEAPGPLTVTSAETVEAVRAALAGERSTETARRYLHWQERYLSTELGTATTRTVDALLAAVDAAS